MQRSPEEAFDLDYRLRLACFEGSIEDFDFINELNPIKRTGMDSPLFIAAANGHFELVKHILNLEESPNLEDCVQGAMRSGKPEIFELLLEHGASFDNPQMIYTLWQTKPKDQLRLFKTMLKGGFNEREKNASGDTPFHFILSLEMIDFLLEHGYDPNAINDNRETPLSLASSKASLSVIKKLVSISLNQHESASLWRSTNNKDLEVFKYLVGFGCDYFKRKLIWTDVLVTGNYKLSKVLFECGFWAEKDFLDSRFEKHFSEWYKGEQTLLILSARESPQSPLYKDCFPLDLFKVLFLLIKKQKMMSFIEKEQH